MSLRKNGLPDSLHLWLPTHVWEELEAEAARLNRSMSWMMRWAWKLSRESVKAMPSPEEQVRQAMHRVPALPKLIVPPRKEPREKAPATKRRELSPEEEAAHQASVMEQLHQARRDELARRVRAGGAR